MRRKRYERKAGFRIGNPAAAAVLSLFGNACRKWRTANLIRGAFVQDGADCIPDPSGSQLFRRFGQQGYGYNVSALREEIGKILGLSLPKKTILIGAGNLGRAILAHMAFAEKGFSIVGVFDRDEDFPAKCWKESRSGTPTSWSSFAKRKNRRLAILCVPKMASQDLVRRLVELGIKGFWNFSHYDIGVYYPDVAVENVHLGDSLMTLCYEMQALENRNEK